MLPWRAELAGRLDTVEIDSELLRGNPLGDPHTRPLLVQLPPGYDGSGQRYPVVYQIQGYSGNVMGWFNRAPFRQPAFELIDAAFASGESPPGIVVYVDCWTALGGSQFLDSPGTGAYHSYLCDEVVPWVDAHYRTIADRDHRAIAGKSSGGYGAMITPMLRPDLFGALATHAGDALFEACYIPDFPQAARLLRDHYDGRMAVFLADFRSRIPMTRAGDDDLISLYAYAACYSAEPDGTVLLPFDATGALRPEVWDRWLAWDPVRMADEPRYAEALRSLRAVWIDAGARDDYYLDLGAEAFRDKVIAAGLPAERLYYELFDATHAAIEYRYPLAVAWLLTRMTEE
jgi:putative esterase